MLKDCPLVGEEFLGNIYSALQEMKLDTKLPHMYEHYNISAWFKSPLLNQSKLGRIINSFIDAINSKLHLPKYMFMIPHDDIV